MWKKFFASRFYLCLLEASDVPPVPRDDIENAEGTNGAAVAAGNVGAQAKNKEFKPLDRC